MSTIDVMKRKVIEDKAQLTRRKATLPRSIAEHARGEVSTILVGPDKVEFIVHESLLIEHSPFFAAEPKPHGKQAGSGIDLENVCVEGFELVINWIYRKELPVLATNNNSDLFEKFLASIHIAYKTADQLFMLDLQDQLVEMLRHGIKRYGWNLTLRGVFNIADNDLLHTPFYKFVLKTAIYALPHFSGALQSIDKATDLLMDHPAVLKDVVHHMALFMRSPWIDPRENTDCEFHVHGKVERCPLLNRGS